VGPFCQVEGDEHAHAHEFVHGPVDVRTTRWRPEVGERAREAASGLSEEAIQVRGLEGAPGGERLQAVELPAKSPDLDPGAARHLRLDLADLLDRLRRVRWRDDEAGRLRLRARVGVSAVDRGGEEPARDVSSFQQLKAGTIGASRGTILHDASSDVANDLKRPSPSP
jgi:hypothetical protein